MPDDLIPLAEIERLARDLEGVAFDFSLHEPVRQLLAAARLAHTLREENARLVKRVGNQEKAIGINVRHYNILEHETAALRAVVEAARIYSNEAGHDADCAFMRCDAEDENARGAAACDCGYRALLNALDAAPGSGKETPE